MALSRDPGLTRPAIATVNGWQLLVADPVAELASFDQLDRFAQTVGWRDERTTPWPSPPLAVGFLNDDLSRELLRLPPDRRPPAAPLPPLRFGVYDWAVAISPAGRPVVLAAGDDASRIARWVRRGRPTAETVEPAPREAQGSLSQREHAAAVAQLLDWIAAGDLYQANVTLQLCVPWRHSAHDLAQRLWRATPAAAHAALLVAEDGAIVSASPETFLRVSGGSVVTRPIKGTRARRRNATADRAAADALRSSAKDHAEHVMIVDLERNDLGRVCEPGSVTVPTYAELEAHPTVWHLTSTVHGRLRRDVRLSDVLAATFPPGSVTGTPKRMAVARTAVLEPVRRGVYCGAVGVVGHGLVDLSVAIRTAVVAGGVASYGTGGAIVADSSAADEYAEAMAKAAAFLGATNAVVG